MQLTNWIRYRTLIGLALSVGVIAPACAPMDEPSIAAPQQRSTLSVTEVMVTLVSPASEPQATQSLDDDRPVWWGDTPGVSLENLSAVFKQNRAATPGWNQISSSVYYNLRFIAPATLADGTPLPERFVVDQLVLRDDAGQVKQSVVVTRSGDGNTLRELRSCDSTVCKSLDASNSSVSSLAAEPLVDSIGWDPSKYFVDEAKWRELVVEQTESPFKNITLEQQQELTSLDDGRVVFAVSITQTFDPWLALPQAGIESVGSRRISFFDPTTAELVGVDQYEMFVDGSVVLMSSTRDQLTSLKSVPDDIQTALDILENSK